MHQHNHPCACCEALCSSLTRRRWMKGVAASALAAQMGLLDFASELFAAPLRPKSQPAVRVLFIRPKDQKQYWMSWPGNDYNADAKQKEFTETLTRLANELGITLQVDAAAVEDDASADAALERMKAAKPDGAMVIQMHLSYWKPTNRVLEKCGVPAIVFARMGTTFTGQMQVARKLPRVYVASTTGLQWLRYGMRMFKTMADMRQSRLCILRGEKTEDKVLQPVGTTLHYVPVERWVKEFQSRAVDDQVRAVAEHYSKTARKTIEPNTQNILDAAKNYFVARRIMETENCDGISLDCLPLVRYAKIPCPPCIAWSKLNDEGSVGACEADWNAALSLRLVSLLFERPGFMQDPVPDTVNNTLLGAHCSSPTKLAGFDQPPAPFILRDHHESNTGVAPQVLWKEGQAVTVMEFNGPAQIIVGTGRVLRNIDTPQEGGCRTSVELAMDHVENVMDTKGFHQLFVYGTLEQPLRAYGKLAGIEVLPIA